MKRITTILLLLAFLPGCAMQMVRQAEADCREALKDVRLDPLRGRLVPIPEDATLDMLNDQSPLDQDAKAALLALDATLYGCSKKVAAELKEVAPDFAAIVQEAAERQQGLRAWLYRGGLTVGAYNMMSLEVRRDYEAKLVNAQAAFNARLQAGLAGAAATQQMMQSLQPVPQPMRTTTCTPFGNQVRCTTF